MLQASEIPKIVIHGDADPLIPLRNAKKFAERIPKTQLQILKDMGHTLPRRYHKTIFDLIHEGIC
jgi:pimeloyl-ACP methyl ester carboxylesterase